MNIPRSILEKGGEGLKEYIALSIEIADLESKLNNVEADIIYGFTEVNKYIEGYLPKRTGYYYGDDDLDLNCREIIPNVIQRKTLDNIYMTEETLKKIRGWILDEKVISSNLKTLMKKRQELKNN